MKAQEIIAFLQVEVLILAFMASCSEGILCSSAHVQRVIVFNQTSCIKHTVVRGGQRPLRPQESQHWHARKPEKRKKPRAESQISSNSRIFFDPRIFPRSFFFCRQGHDGLPWTSSEITCGIRSIRENMTVGGSCQRFIIPSLPQIWCLAASCHLTPTQRPGGLQRDTITQELVTLPESLQRFCRPAGRQGFSCENMLDKGKPGSVYEASWTVKGAETEVNTAGMCFLVCSAFCLAFLILVFFLQGTNEPWPSRPTFYTARSLVALSAMQRWNSLCVFVSPLVWIDSTVACVVSAAVAAADGPHIEDELRAFMFDFAVQ